MAEVDYQSTLDHLPRVYSFNRPQTVIRTKPEDFIVNESLSFEPSGEGDHLFLKIKKIDCNTDWVAKELEKYFELGSADVGYAGKKDKVSVSTQWFSLHIPGNHSLQIEVTSKTLHPALHNESFQVIEAIKHNKKLRKGSISANHFKIKLNCLTGKIQNDAISAIQRSGCPNYFGYQRFGHHSLNIVNGLKMMKKEIKVRSKNKRGLYISALRSYLFNLLIAERIKLDGWIQPLADDCFMLNESRSLFNGYVKDDGEWIQIIQRLKQGDIHTTALLVGNGGFQISECLKQFESEVLSGFEDWIQYLKSARLSGERRSTRFIPKDLVLEMLDDDNAWISFSLPTGCYATSLLRELVELQDVSRLQV